MSRFGSLTYEAPHNHGINAMEHGDDTDAQANGRDAMSPREIARRVAMALTAKLSAAAPATNALGSDPPRVLPAQRYELLSSLASAPPSAAAPPTLATAYVSMLPYAYTNNDVAQLFSPFGKLARVTILRDKQTRKSRGVAFVQFARAEDCARAVECMHDTELEGFRLACSVSRDNGRAQEFARKRKYPASSAPNASRCFECGEYGHFSYNCPLNVLGARERPVNKKKLKKKKKFDPHERIHYFNDEGTTNLLAPPQDMEQDISISLLAYPSNGTAFDPVDPGNTRGVRKARRVGSYFSDESGSDDEDVRGGSNLTGDH